MGHKDVLLSAGTEPATFRSLTSIEQVTLRLIIIQYSSNASDHD